MTSTLPLIITHPHLCEELIDLTLGQVLTRGSDKRVDWVCAFSHPYQASVANRVQGRGCPFCAAGPFVAELATRNISFAREVLEQIRTQSHRIVDGVECKICTRCFEIFPLDRFYKSAKSKDGHKPYCKDCGRQSSLTWARTHEMENKARASAWYAQNRERGKARSAEFASKNPEKVLEYKKRYSMEHPEVSRATSHRRRARMRGSAAEKFLDSEIFERDLWICQICGEPIDQSAKAPEPLSRSLDHITPISKGGSHTRENVQTAHLQCNIKKSDKT
jgi:rRNA maturation endonuclease Nob1